MEDLSKVPLNELEEMFPKGIPSEALFIIFNSPPETPLSDIRSQLMGIINRANAPWQELIEDQKVLSALQTAYDYGQINGEEHKDWVIDQMVRILTGDLYSKFIADYKENDQYEWSEGVAP